MSRTHRHGAAAFTALCLGATLWQADLAAQGKNTTADSIAGSLVQVRVYPSRPNPTAGSGLGVQADIENRSSTTVYLRSQDVRLTLPPELQGPQVREREGLPALLPTEDQRADGSSFIALKPNDTYTVFWRAEPGGPGPRPKPVVAESLVWAPGSGILWPIIDNELNFMFFAPGEYRLVANVKYWTEPKFDTTNYRTVRQEAVLQVSAPVFVILFGAGIGGLIAYLVFPDLRPRPKRRLPFFPKACDNGTIAELFALGGSVFLSVITTILLSRIAESQFLVRVTVNDVWGAIAVGFLANFAGYNVLAPYLRTKEDGKDGTDKSSGNRPAVPEMTDREIEQSVRAAGAQATQRA